MLYHVALTIIQVRKGRVETGGVVIILLSPAGGVKIFPRC